MDGNDDVRPPAECSTQPSFSIANIFKSIQQKISETKTQNSDTNNIIDSVCVKKSVKIPEHCGYIPDAISDISQVQSKKISQEPPALSESDNHCLSNEVSEFLAPISEIKELRNNGTAETPESASGLQKNCAVELIPVHNSSVISESRGSAISTVYGHDSTVIDHLKQNQRSNDSNEEDAVVSKSSSKDTNELMQAEHFQCVSDQIIPENETSLEQQNNADMNDSPTDRCSGSPSFQRDNTVVHIKKEKNDVGYDFFHHVTSSNGKTFTDAEQVRVKQEPLEPGVLIIKREAGENADLENDPDVVFHGISYRDPDDSSSESDSETSSLSSFEMEPEVEESVPPIVRSVGEVMPEELPPLENLHISLPEETKLEQLGVVTGIVGVLVVIESTANLDQYSPLNEESVLFYENRDPFGVVFEVFGPCLAPSYSVRFNSAEDIQKKGIEIGLKVFFVPEPVPEMETITHFVFVQKLKQIRGSDASWRGDNEPPPQFLQYSDDEEEKRSKAKRKVDRKKGTATDATRDTDEDKKRKKGTDKKHVSSSAQNDGCDRPDSFGRSRYTNADERGNSQSSPGSGSRREHFSFRKPVFRAPASSVSNAPPQQGPWTSPPPPGPTCPPPFHPRRGSFENRWTSSPFLGGHANGFFGNGDQVRPTLGGASMGPPFPDTPGSVQPGGAPMRPPFPDTPGSVQPGSAPMRPPFPDAPGIVQPGSVAMRPPFSHSPGGGCFEGAPPVRPSFFDNGPGQGSFSSRPVSVSPSPSHNFWRPPNASDSTFPVDTSVPPPRFPAISPAQVNIQQGHPPPPPPPWTPPPGFGGVFGSAAPSPTPPTIVGDRQPFAFSPSPTVNSGDRTPANFSPSPGLGGPQQPGFSAGPSLSSARFQGQPQFVQYHQQRPDW